MPLAYSAVAPDGVRVLVAGGSVYQLFAAVSSPGCSKSLTHVLLGAAFAPATPKTSASTQSAPAQSDANLFIAPSPFVPPARLAREVLGQQQHAVEVDGPYPDLLEG